MGETAAPAPGKGREGRLAQRIDQGKAHGYDRGPVSMGKRRFLCRGRDGQAGPSREWTQESPRTDCGPVSMGETAVPAPEKGREGRSAQRKDQRKAHGMIVGLFGWGKRRFSRRRRDGQAGTSRVRTCSDGGKGGSCAGEGTGRPVSPEKGPGKATDLAVDL